jgi:putative nucleotidyltransferase with HDIG domain
MQQFTFSTATSMITESEALVLLRKYLDSEGRIAHSILVADFAFALASRIHAAHPELEVDPAKVKIGALLHDIGRGRKGDHELNSVEILSSEGLPELAAIVMHGSIYEIMLLRGRDDPALLPQSIENKIVAYADARCKNEVMTMQDRWAEIEERRKDETEKIASLRMAKERFFALERELLELCA